MGMCAAVMLPPLPPIAGWHRQTKVAKCSECSFKFHA